jgi:glutamate-1-semialdehyde aminotransferase
VIRIDGVTMTTEPATEAATHGLRRERQAALYRRAMQSLPGGTDSNFRAWGDDTIYIDRGKGATVWDIDGNEYIDLRMGYGPVILAFWTQPVSSLISSIVWTSSSLVSEKLTPFRIRSLT